MEYLVMTAKWQRGIIATSFLLLSLFPNSFSQTVRELMHAATPIQRSASFQSFLSQHGKRCEVSKSDFSAKLTFQNISGDAWSVRCTDNQEFAVFISADAISTSWFIACKEVARLSNFRCFQSHSSQAALE